MIYHQIFFKNSDGNTRMDQVCAFDSNMDSRCVGQAYVKTWYKKDTRQAFDVTGNITEQKALSTVENWHKHGK